MRQERFYCAGKTAASQYAAGELEKCGVSLAAEPSAAVTGVLLDVPSLDAGGELRMGGSLDKLLEELPNAVIFGGNLPPIPGHKAVDLLQDALYQAENAYITAECALEIALTRLPRTIRDCPVLIIGWGRIGRCLAKLLGSLGAEVTVCARRASHRALAQALGYTGAEADYLGPQLPGFSLIFNTVPAAVFTPAQLERCRDSVKIELASRQGLVGADVIIARGLPGIHMPESSGKLIARTCLRQMKEA